MSEQDDFLALIGSEGHIKKVKNNDISEHFYTQKELTPEKKQYAERFEHSAISQSGYDIGVEDEIEFSRSGVQNHLMKKLAKGELSVYEDIDLHGMTTMEAEVYMSNTIDSQRFHHMTCIRIVHGKGYNVGDSPYDKPAPKLKNFTARYLAEHPRVLAYTSCPQNRGGTGAVYVLLSRFDEDYYNKID